VQLANSGTLVHRLEAHLFGRTCEFKLSKRESPYSFSGQAADSRGFIVFDKDLSEGQGVLYEKEGNVTFCTIFREPSQAEEDVKD